jgi:hypothetical protein
MNAHRMNLLDHGVPQTDTWPLGAIRERHGRSLVHEDLQVRRSSVFGGVREEAAGLSAPIVIAPRQQLVGGGRRRHPGTDLPVEPGLLLMRIVLRQKRSEPIGAEVAGED